jgi:hypothetical protein
MRAYKSLLASEHKQADGTASFKTSYVGNAAWRRRLRLAGIYDYAFRLRPSGGGARGGERHQSLFAIQ